MSEVRTQFIIIMATGCVMDGPGSISASVRFFSTAFLAANPEVPGSIPGATRFSA
jgi:hypothetical protein